MEQPVNQSRELDDSLQYAATERKQVWHNIRDRGGTLFNRRGKSWLGSRDYGRRRRPYDGSLCSRLREAASGAGYGVCGICEFYASAVPGSEYVWHIKGESQDQKRE